jgi:hypothetical protein
MSIQMMGILALEVASGGVRVPGGEQERVIRIKSSSNDRWGTYTWGESPHTNNAYYSLFLELVYAVLRDELAHSPNHSRRSQTLCVWRLCLSNDKGYCIIQPFSRLITVMNNE